jgi:hypothetical protein
MQSTDTDTALLYFLRILQTLVHSSLIALVTNKRRKTDAQTDFLINYTTFLCIIIMSAISKQQRVKGEAFLSEAETTLAKRTWFASSSEQKYEDAAELYGKAANAFKVGGFFTEAGDAYSKAANIFKDKLKNGMEASKALTESGEFFRAFLGREAFFCMSV